MRERKTVDTWEILINYSFGDGWEHECTEFSASAARETRNLYHDAGFPCTKVVRRRMKIADMTAHDLMSVAKASHITKKRSKT